MGRLLVGYVILTSFLAGAGIASFVDKLDPPLKSGQGNAVTLGPSWMPKFATPKCEGKNAFEKMCEVPLTPKIITLRFVAREDFELNRPVQNSIGYARIDNNPCEVVVPAVGVMTFNPYGTYVGMSGSMVGISGNIREFYPYDAQQTLIHEILHCFAGLWHPSSSVLEWYANEANLRRIQNPEMQQRMFLARITHDEPKFQLWDRIDPSEMKYWRTWKHPYEFVTVQR